MGIITKNDFNKWFMERDTFTPDSDKATAVVAQLNHELNVISSDELYDFIRLTDDQDIAPIQGMDTCMAKYDKTTQIVLIDVLFCSEAIIHYTKMLLAAKTSSRSLIIIGADYDSYGDGYIVYDLNPQSATYQHVFHWRYHSDPVIPGQGLAILATSLQDFLLIPASRETLREV